MKGAVEEGPESMGAAGLSLGYHGRQCSLTGPLLANMVTSCKPEEKKKIRPCFLKTLYGHLLEILINNDKLRMAVDMSSAP